MKYIVFLGGVTKERAVVSAEGMGDSPPSSILHPDNQSLKFTFWTKEEGTELKNTFWCYLPDNKS